MAEHKSRLAAILRDEGPAVLADWSNELTRAGALGGVDRAERQEQARTFVYPEMVETVTTSAEESIDPARPTVLLVEDSPQDVLLYEHYFRSSSFQLATAATIRDARRLLARVRPVAMVLDIRLAGDDAWGFIAELRQSEATRTLPLVVVTSIDDQAKGLALGADAYALKPVDRSWLLETIGRLVAESRGPRLLVIDDDEIARYLVRARLHDTPLTVHEARLHQPQAIVLDLVMPEMTGFEVMARLKEDPATTDIPVIVLTSKLLSDEERRRLAPHAASIISKDALAGPERPNLLRDALAAVGLPVERGHG
jgi:CheY-like chemotaxis protein